MKTFDFWKMVALSRDGNDYELHFG